MASANRKALMNMLGPDEEQLPPGAIMGPPVDPMQPDFPGGGSDNTGIAGGRGGPAPILDQPLAAPPMADVATAPAAPDYTKRGKFSTFNATSDKYNRPWDDLSERYKMQTVMSNFDPSKGVTPELVAALNSANIKGAKFSGDRDKLSATGLSQWEGYDGREGLGDVIQGFNDPNNVNKSWGAWQPEDGAPGGGGAPMHGGADLGGAGFGGAQLDESLNGDPLAKIQQLIAQLSGSRPNFAALMQQLGGQ